MPECLPDASVTGATMLFSHGVVGKAREANQNSLPCTFQQPHFPCANQCISLLSPTHSALCQVLRPEPGGPSQLCISLPPLPVARCLNIMSTMKRCIFSEDDFDAFQASQVRKACALCRVHCLAFRTKR